MKKLIVVIGLLVYAGFNVQGQGVGTFEFMNVGVPDNRKIYVGEFLTGTKAEGNGYQIAVFYGPAGITDENALVQVGTSIGFLPNPGEGQFNGGVRTIFGLSEDGAVVTLQARAWDASTGATWGEAVSNPAGRIGKGPVFEMKLKDPADISEPFPPRLGYAAGWQGFAIAVPEPSVWGLALAGAMGLMVLRRRRS